VYVTEKRKLLKRFNPRLENVTKIGGGAATGINARSPDGKKELSKRFASRDRGRTVHSTLDTTALFRSSFHGGCSVEIRRRRQSQDQGNTLQEICTQDISSIINRYQEKIDQISIKYLTGFMKILKTGPEAGQQFHVPLALCMGSKTPQE